MMDDSDAVPGDALDDIAYLARSANRVRLLDALTTGSYTRRDLDDHTGIARTTIGRILNEFEERGWVERTSDGDYTATPVGDQVAAEFTPLVESMAVIRNLGEMVAWLQTDVVSIDLRHFRDATIRRPDPVDPMAPSAHLTERLREATRFHCLVGVAPPVGFEKAMRDGVVDRELAVEHVISASECAYIRGQPERVARWREYIRAGANVYRYEGSVPCNLLVFDDTVYIGHSQAETGETYTLIESANETVRAWAADMIDWYREESERLYADMFT